MERIEVKVKTARLIKRFGRKNIAATCATLKIDLVLLGLCAATQYAEAYSGGSGTEVSPFLIYNKTDLLELATDTLSVDNSPTQFHYKLIADVDLVGEVFTNAVIAPNLPNWFAGTFNGNGHVIKNMNIQTGSTSNNAVGLFGLVIGGTIKNLGVEDFNIVGDHIISGGGLCGSAWNGVVSNCYTTGSILGGSSSSGLGGVCGTFGNSILPESRMSGCYSTASISAGSNSTYLGGLLGTVYANATVNGCYALGPVSGGSDTIYAGGLCGAVLGGTLNHCYALGSVSGDAGALAVGGLCGGVTEQGTMTSPTGVVMNCYATGRVSGGSSSYFIGGLTGMCGIGGKALIEKCYSTGSVINGAGSLGLGGFCGYLDADGIINDCFWDQQATGIFSSEGGSGKYTGQMQDQATFISAGWDFTVEWFMDGYPNLIWQIPLVGFDAWVTAQGIPAHLQGHEDAPAGDGIANLLKYASGFPAMIQLGPSDFFTSSIDPAAQQLVVIYHKSKGLTDATIFPVHTGYLTAGSNQWKTNGITTMWISDDLEQETWQASIPLQESDYVRLRATYND